MNKAVTQSLFPPTSPAASKPAHAQTLDQLAERIRQELLDVFESSQRAASDSYLAAKGRGADGYTFGVNSWSYARNLLRKRVQEEHCTFELESGPGCILSHGPFRIRHHRVGESELQEIQQSFPQGAQQLVKEFQSDPSILRENLRIQPMLFELEQLFSQEQLNKLKSPGPKQVVLAYFSHPEHGLRAMYLSTIGKIEDGTIVEWAAAIPVWLAAAPLPQDEPEVTPEPTPLLDFIEQRTSQDERT